MNKYIVLFFAVSWPLIADVKLVNITNATDMEMNIFIEDLIGGKGTSQASNAIRVLPHDEKNGLNIDLRSKKNSNPSVLRIPKCGNYKYIASGETPSIDLIIEKNTVRVIPTSPRINTRENKKSGQDWIFDNVLIKSVENKSPHLVQVLSGGKRFEEMLVMMRSIDVAPGKKDKTTITLDRGQELVIYVIDKEGKPKRAEYLPTGKAETLEIFIDDHGTPFVQEQRQERIAVPFDDSKR